MEKALSDKRTKSRLIIWIATLLFVVIAGGAGIFWARGFKFGPKQGLSRTGTIVATSIPDAAILYLDDRPTSATNTTITYLEPKTYRVKIQKEGYTIWEKEVAVRADLVTEIKALLFPLAPDLRPLTLSGAKNPLLSPDGQKIAFTLEGLAGGIYVIDLVERPLTFRRDPRQIVKNTPTLNFSSAQMTFSPDSRTLLVRIQEGGKEGEAYERNYLLDPEKINTNILDSTATLAATLNDWRGQIIQKENVLVFQIPPEVRQATEEAKTPPPPTKPAAKEAAERPEEKPINYHPSGFIFSPDETKVLFKRSKDGKDTWFVYDLKKKKEFSLSASGPKQIIWYPDSDHLILVEEKGVFIIEADGANKLTVYGGPIFDSFIGVFPSGNRLVILTNFAQSADQPPNLYAINLR